MRKGRVTGHLPSGTTFDKTRTLLRRVGSSRNPHQSVTSKRRETERYVSPGKPSMPTLRFLEKKDDG